MKLASGDQVRLYGTPGQKRFDFMWDILTENALGLVLMLRGNSPDPVADLRTYVTEFRDFIDRTSVVVGITHSDQGGWQTRQMVSRELVAMGLPPTAMDTDARSRAHMATLVKALIYGIDPFNNAEE
jgi:signal recognition particle receptor subunit beta